MKYLDAVKSELIADEYEYCYSRDYYSDKQWTEEFPNETREEAFLKTVRWLEKVSYENIFAQYGDKYEYVKNRFKEE